MEESKELTIYEKILHDENCMFDFRKFMRKLHNDIMGIPTKQFCEDLLMDDQYYYQIVSGYLDKNGNRKFKQPTFKYFASRLKYAFKSSSYWKSKENEIKNLFWECTIGEVI